MKKYNIGDIKKILVNGFKIKGNTQKNFDNIKTIEDADAFSLVWINSKRKDRDELIKKTKASFIICDDEISAGKNLLKEKAFIITENPKLVFIKITAALFSKKQKNGIHPTAVISKGAVIAKGVYIGPFVYVGKSEIKSGAVIHGNTFIYDNVIIGENVIIHAGCVIGSDGFGYERNEKEEFEKFLHSGGVIIEKNVEIGANSCIDRGTLGNTLIKEGAKIDNLVHISHNVTIGKHTLVIANSMVGGSTTVGDYSWVSPSVSLINKIKVGNKVTVGMGAVVTKDIPDGEVWAGSPARPLNEFVEILKKLKKI